MTLRKLLIIPIATSIGLLMFFSDNIERSSEVLRQNITINAHFIFIVMLAICMQFIAHVLRAYKMKYLLSPVKQGTTRFQLRALSIGYLCNVLLPLKLGEILRAKIIAAGEKTSFGLALILVLIERVLDALLLLIMGFFLYASSYLDRKAVGYLIVLVVFVVIATIFLVFVGKQNKRMLRLWHRITAFFEKSIKNSLRFKGWSIIYGLQRVVVMKRIPKYVLLTLISWSFYIVSSLLLAALLLPGFGLDIQLIRAVAPYFGMSVPAGPASLGAFSAVTNSFATHASLGSDMTIILNLLAWALLALPISLLGLLLLVLKTPESARRHLPTGYSNEALSDKLSRKEDITPEMESFLDSYFSGNTLSHIVHKLELRDDFRLLRYFKGGSDAITLLAMQNGKNVVKKIIPAELAPRLRAQYDWLKKRGGKNGVVKVLGERAEKDYYSIDLAYNKDYEMFFEYMHHNTIDESKKVLDKVWSRLHKNIYSSLTPTTDSEAVKDYIDKHVYSCMEKACVVSQDLMDASIPDKITINGKAYDNFHVIMAKIKNNRNAMQDLATFSRSEEVHGDVAIDNILVSRLTGSPMLIDPAPDGNIITGPVFDFGKNMQSLYCGYEFIVRSDDFIRLQADGSIEYYNRRSVPYMQLCDYVREELSAQYLTEHERRAMIFHAGALLIRRLKHQVYQAPGVTLAIYGAGIQALNDFLNFYEADT